MTAKNMTPEVRDAAVRGAIEILVNPEFGTDWILNEVLRDIPDEDVNEEVAEQVDDFIMSRFKEFAATLLSELPAEKRQGLEFITQ